MSSHVLCNPDGCSGSIERQRYAVGSRLFAPFRFPTLPYDTVQSPYIRELIREGSFDDLEYRRHVNDLVYIEWYATGGRPTGTRSAHPLGTPTHYPTEYDIVRRELDATTRADMQPKDEMSIGAGDVDERLQEAKAAWQRVQEATR